jgi:C1A family cysteine protease
MYYGCKPSKLDGTEIIVDDVLDNMDIPAEYSYLMYLPNAYDQGNRPTCVPHAISAFVDWYNGVNGIDGDMSIDWIYDCRENKDGEGMTLKEALKYIKKVGYTTKQDYKNIRKGESPELDQINMYGMLNSVFAMQRSLLINGPFILALPVYDSSRSDFWNGSKFEGGHAVACVGYDEYGLIIRNSWGTMWGAGGYCTLPYEQVNKIYEAWALIKY